MISRRKALHACLVGGGLIFVAFLLPNLFILSALHNPENAVGTSFRSLSSEEAREDLKVISISTPKAVVDTPQYTPNLRMAEQVRARDITPNPTMAEVVVLQSTTSPNGLEAEVPHSATSSIMAEVDNTTRLRTAESNSKVNNPTIAAKVVVLQSTTSPKAAEVNAPHSTPSPTVSVTEFSRNMTSPEVAAVDNTTRLRVAESNSTRSPTIGEINSTRTPTMAKVSNTRSPTVTNNNTTSLRIVQVEIPNNTTSQIVAKVNRIRRMKMAEGNNTRSPKVEAIKTPQSTPTPESESDVKVLPSMLTPKEAEEVLWALVVHFTGNFDRFKSVTNTWFKRTHPRMAIVIFTSEKNRALMSSSGIPAVYYPSTELVTEHSLNAISAALSMFPNAVYISKADDDGYVYTQKLANTLFSNIPYNYQGLKCPAQDELLNLGKDFVYACGGSGYTLTRYGAEKLVNLANPPPHGDYEDVGVGLRLKYALGAEFRLHPIAVHARNFWSEMKRRIPKSPPLSYHYIIPSMMNMIHDEAYHWRPGVRRSRVPRIFHHLESEPIHPSCRKLNPKWTIMTWTPKTIKRLSRKSRNDTALVQYDVLFRHGGIYLKPGDRCTQPLDARLDQFSKDFDHDGYYLAYDFHEYGFRSGLFVIRPLSDASMMLYHLAGRNPRIHPLEYLKSFRISVAVLPAAGLFEKG